MRAGTATHLGRAAADAVSTFLEGPHPDRLTDEP
ncbi:hypothetical protein J2805_004303 [Arthrobacter oryzae]|nr:hypothetical protein [Arthrobacter oryzae]